VNRIRGKSVALLSQVAMTNRILATGGSKHTGWSLKNLLDAGKRILKCQKESLIGKSAACCRIMLGKIPYRFSFSPTLMVFSLCEGRKDITPEG
jgi:hypothetical protein